MEMRGNVTGRYLLFLVFLKDGKKYFVIVPGGFNLLDWVPSARKLWNQGFKGASGFEFQ